MNRETEIKEKSVSPSSAPPPTLPTRRLPRVWSVKEAAPPEFIQALQLKGFTPLTAQLLYNRKLQTVEAVDYFFNANYKDLADPFLIKDMDKAVERIRHALDAHERIAIYGDFDADGVTACSLLVQFFKSLEVEVVPRIPHRVDEGYGLNPTALKRLHGQGITLVITVDCGVSNVAEVDFARQLGMDIIITDHHRPPEVLPQATAILNVRQNGCQYPYKGVAGVGMAFHLVRALSQVGIKGKGLKPSDLLDLVALGTVADISPLTGENRVLVASGLKAMNKTTRPGIVALVEAAKLKHGELDVSSIGYFLAPRINAAGRIDDAIIAYELLLTDSLERARQLAHELNAKNRERQVRLTQILEEARAKVIGDRLAEKQKLLLVSGTEWTAGVVGLVAGRLCEEYSRPVLVLERGPEFSKGSARSPYSFNIIEALSECSDLLERFGGHRQAAGFTVATKNLPELERRLLQIAEEKVQDSELLPRLEIDMIVTVAELKEAYLQSQPLEPFGSENPQPLFACLGLKVKEARPVGVEGAHLKLRAFDPHNLKSLDGIGFGEGWRALDIKAGNLVDIVFSLELNDFNGQRNLQARLKDIRISQVSESKK